MRFISIDPYFCGQDVSELLFLCVKIAFKRVLIFNFKRLLFVNYCCPNILFNLRDSSTKL